ncbi:hypothetical protein [Brevibacillus reuszeri]|uniref:hypothetical protein n=1 Tax=Brevibacillus reuszeri TaxID=54915 RepID=UPI001142CA33|nr:hypothetical protein [Brevibacillus reuszeri]
MISANLRATKKTAGSYPRGLVRLVLIHRHCLDLSNRNKQNSIGMTDLDSLSRERFRDPGDRRSIVRLDRDSEDS